MALAFRRFLVPNAPLRAGVTARAGFPIECSVKGVAVKTTEQERPRSPSSYLWDLWE